MAFNLFGSSRRLLFGILAGVLLSLELRVKSEALSSKASKVKALGSGQLELM